MPSQQCRLVPQLPPPGQRLRVIFDTDIATEIDDVYAIAMALCSQDRFAIEGFSAAHFANKAGSDSIARSFALLQELLDVAGWAGRVPVAHGSHPMRYSDEPSPSEGTQLIIERAHAGSPADPLWVVGLGAASTLASALLIDPSILPKVRYVFHCRSELTWPERNDQYNVYGDTWAARNLLTSSVPLVWFDTGQQLTCPYEVTAARLAPCGRLGAWLHAFRDRCPWYRDPNKGFFDVADIAWMIDPAVCTNEEIDAPSMDWSQRFQHRGGLGRMLRVSQVQAGPAWELFFQRLASPLAEAR